MAGDPADIGHTGELVLGVNIEDIFEGQGGAEKITSSGVHYTLWFSSGSRGLEKSRPIVKHGHRVSENFGYSHRG